MYRVEIERKNLKIHYKAWSPVILLINSGLADDIDLTPVVRLLSSVSYEKEAVNQVA